MSRNRNNYNKSEKSFRLPNKEVPPGLRLALEADLKITENMSTDAKMWVGTIKTLIEPDAIPSDKFGGRLLAFERLLYVEQYYAQKEVESIQIKSQNPYFDDIKQRFTIEIPSSDKNLLVTPGDFVLLDDHVLIIDEIHSGALIASPYGGRNDPSKWYSKDQIYNIKLKYSNYTMRCAYYAIERMKSWSLKKDLLDPATMQTRPTNKTVVSIDKWYNPNVTTNYEQQQAVRCIVGKNAHPAPFILFGPPGTGKTSTVIEAIAQIYHSDSGSKMLVCTPSNAAADDIVRRLSRYISERDIYRFMSSSLTTKPKDKSEQSEQKIDREATESRVVICTLTTSFKFAELPNSCSHFSHMFIDEAAQATEPETLIPLSLLINEYGIRYETQVVLSGDPLQLGPVIKSHLLERLLGISLMERLMYSNYYQTPEAKETRITKLLNNFRSHNAILKVPNDEFYDRELVACGGSEILKGVGWEHLPNKQFPIIFHNVNGTEMKEKGNPSPYNLKEIDVVVDYVYKLTKNRLFKQRHIGVITPFKLQEKYIKVKLRELNMTDVDVGTVQVFQGKEKEVIILSTVRSRYLEHGDSKHVGFLSNKRRFNVAITRAKCLLIVLGNPEILNHDKTWSKFINYCVDNKAFTGEKFSL